MRPSKFSGIIISIIIEAIRQVLLEEIRALERHILE